MQGAAQVRMGQRTQLLKPVAAGLCCGVTIGVSRPLGAAYLYTIARQDAQIARVVKGYTGGPFTSVSDVLERINA